MFIDNASRAWRMLSVQVAAVAVGFGAMPLDTQQVLLDLVGVPAGRVPAILGLLMIAGRLVAQPKVGP